MLGFLRRLWLLFVYQPDWNHYVLLRSGKISKIKKAPGIWEDEWETQMGTVHTRDIRAIGDKHDAYGLT